MPKYEVHIKQVSWITYEIEAKNAEEAKQKVLNGEGVETSFEDVSGQECDAEDVEVEEAWDTE